MTEQKRTSRRRSMSASGEYQANFKIYRTDGSVAYSGVAKSQVELLKRAIEENVDLRNIQINGNITLTGVDFNGTDLSGAEIMNATFSSCRFNDVKLNGAVINKAVFSGCRFNRTQFGAISAANSGFPGSAFIHCRLRGSTFEKVNLSDTVWRSTSFTRSSIQECIIRNADIMEVDFGHSAIIKNDFKGSRFARKKIRFGKQEYLEEGAMIDLMRNTQVAMNTYGSKAPKIEANTEEYRKRFSRERLIDPGRSEDRIIFRDESDMHSYGAFAGEGKFRRYLNNTTKLLVTCAFTAAIVLYMPENIVSIMEGDSLAHLFGFEDLKQSLENAASDIISISGIAAVSAVAGNAAFGLIRQKIEDRVIDTVTTSMGFMKKHWEQIKNAASNLQDAAIALTRNRDAGGVIRYALAAISDDPNASFSSKSKVSFITDNLSDSEIVVCDRQRLAKALQYLASQRGAGIGKSGRDIFIINNMADDNSPACVAFRKNGDVTIVWKTGQAPTNVVTYNRSGEVVSALNFSGTTNTNARSAKNNRSGSISLEQAIDRFEKGILRKNEIALEYPKDTHHIQCGRDGTILVYSNDRRQVDNPLGPALIRPSGEQYHFHQGVHVRAEKEHEIESGLEAIPANEDERENYTRNKIFSI